MCIDFTFFLFQISNIKTILEEQIKLISILRKQENCPIAQKMKEL